MNGDDLRRIAADPQLMKVAHIAIENRLVEWRDERLSTPFRANGLVIRERDGKNSDIIRMGPDEAMAVGLRAIADHLDSAT